VSESNGFAIAVEDDEINAAQEECAKTDGILLCPEGAATLAAYKAALKSGQVSKDERALLFNCATGLKYPMPEAGGFIDLKQPIDYAAMK